MVIWHTREGLLTNALAKAQLLKYCKLKPFLINCVLSLLIYCTTHVESSSIVKEIFGSSKLFFVFLSVGWMGTS